MQLIFTFSRHKKENKNLHNEFCFMISFLPSLFAFSLFHFISFFFVMYFDSKLLFYSVFFSVFTSNQTIRINFGCKNNSNWFGLKIWWIEWWPQMARSCVRGVVRKNEHKYWKRGFNTNNNNQHFVPELYHVLRQWSELATTYVIIKHIEMSKKKQTKQTYNADEEEKKPSQVITV